MSKQSVSACVLTYLKILPHSPTPSSLDGSEPGLGFISLYLIEYILLRDERVRYVKGVKGEEEVMSGE